jgi:hypothetical protein
MTCYRTNRIAEAVSLLRQAIAHKSDGEGYHLVLGTILMEQKTMILTAATSFAPSFA